MKPRTHARSIALQALYEIDIAEHPIGIVLTNLFKGTQLEQRHQKFAIEIVRGITPIRNDLDAYIAEHAPEWPIDQISIIDRNLVRIALWEFAVSKISPVKVAINEAVELAKVYGSDSAPRFVNGVLGSLAERQSEIHLAMKKLEEKAAQDSAEAL